MCRMPVRRAAEIAPYRMHLAHRVGRPLRGRRRKSRQRVNVSDARAARCGDRALPYAPGASGRATSPRAPEEEQTTGEGVGCPCGALRRARPTVCTWRIGVGRPLRERRRKSRQRANVPDARAARCGERALPYAPGTSGRATSPRAPEGNEEWRMQNEEWPSHNPFEFRGPGGIDSSSATGVGASRRQRQAHAIAT